MKHLTISLCSLLALSLTFGSGCARRMAVATGTTIGLHASPGDGQSRPPEVTLAYKRAELALVPTAGTSGRKNPDSDAYSSLAVLDFKTKWFKETKIDQFIATGLASREIQQNGDEFTGQLVAYAASDSAAVLRAWIKSSADKTERKKREKAISDWIAPDAGYNFADLLTDGSLEKERQRFLKEKGAALGITR